jgi:hypothetical protein
MVKRQEARKSLDKDGKSDGQVEEKTEGGSKVSNGGLKVSEEELNKSTENGQGESDLEAGLKRKPLYDISGTNYFQRLIQTFRDARSRRALVCASTAMISQQLCGINTISMYCPN